jgi:hypothetical protein
VWFKDPFPYFHNYGKDGNGTVVIPGSENIEGTYTYTYINKYTFMDR